MPLIRGDTDDDASIHLHTHVGPARPMTKRNYDRQIMEILKRRPLHLSSDAELDLDLEDLNAQFEQFAKQRRASVFSDDEKTETEDDPVGVKNILVQKLRKSSSSNTKSHKLPIESKFALTDLRLLGFMFGILALLLIPYPRLPGVVTRDKIPQDLSGVTSRIELVERRVLALDDITKALSDQADTLGSKQEAFIASITRKVEEISHKFDSISRELASSEQYHRLVQEFSDYKERLLNIEVILDDTNQMEDNLSSISHKLLQLSLISGDLTSFKNSIIKSFTEQLPNYVPVYIKDKKIHYLPEFQKFLQAFVDNSVKKTNTSTDLSDQFSKLEQMVKKQASREKRGTLASYVSKEEFLKVLHEKLAERESVITSKLNDLIDTIDLSKNFTRIDLGHKTNKVVLDNLIDIVSKGSVKINFADYNNGARILGFLTSTGEDSYKRKSVVSRIFFGWYDYFTSNGLRSPEKLKFDANNVLFDLGTYWNCETNSCSIGVRLSSPVILTDIIFKNPSGKNPGLVTPKRAAIYIKPSKKSMVPVLEAYLSHTKPEYLAAGKSNKYLAKFYKIQEVSFTSGAIQHVKLPVSLVNLEILVRDIYIELYSRDGRTGLYNFKAYGLTEYNSLAYAEEFESILDKLHDDTESVDDYYSFEDGKVLGDDDYI